MRDFSPGPMLIRYALRSSNARMPRKSSDSAPGTLEACHVLPPSTVRSHVPPVPLAQTTRSFTALTPRRDAVVLLVCGIQLWAKEAAVKSRVATALIGFYGRSLRGSPASNWGEEMYL